MDTQIPGLQFSSPEAISASIRATRKSFLDHKARDVEFRLVQLRKFYWAIKDHEEDIVKACAQDLNKPYFETEVAESGWLLSDIVSTTRNLHKWMKDEKASDIGLSFKFMKPKTRKDPRDCVLYFQFSLSVEIGPVIGAIAAGNTVASLDPMCYSIVQGDVPEAQALLSQCWDKILFTGRGALTPVVLELGGISPVIVAKTADPRLIARRMLWGSKSLVSRLVEEFKKAYRDNGKILLGSTLNKKELFIEPTVNQVDSVEDSLCTQESIGPFIPILPVNNLDEAINLANSVQCIPLGLDPFGSKDYNAKIISSTRSGRVSLGTYRGRASFNSWVHRRPITISPGWLESILAIRYPPYAGKLSKLKAASTLVPDFDRKGQKQTFGWLRFILNPGWWKREGRHWTCFYCCCS
ncbi:Aldehyde/histidinol dehydrogenase [Aspergillus fruticulosus]